MSLGTPDLGTNLSTADCITTFLEFGSPFIAADIQVPDMPRRIANPAMRPFIPGKRVTVTPGDPVLADEDGIAFCSTTEAPAEIETARGIETDEEEIFARWDAGEGYLRGLGLSDQEGEQR